MEVRPIISKGETLAKEKRSPQGAEVRFEIGRRRRRKLENILLEFAPDMAPHLPSGANRLTASEIILCARRPCYKNGMENRMGRNEACHCGSGRKYGNCCLRRDAQAAGGRGQRYPDAAWMRIRKTEGEVIVAVVSIAPGRSVRSGRGRERAGRRHACKKAATWQNRHAAKE